MITAAPPLPPLLLLLLGLLLTGCAAGPLAPISLRVEYMKQPMGIDVATPRFSWSLQHTDRGQVLQTCMQR